MENTEIRITGTLMWYYFICHREVWLMARQVIPEQDNELIDLDRFLQIKSRLVCKFLSYQ